jgi:hypothetical protein
MPNDVIPSGVREFIIDNIESIGELESLLLMRSVPAIGMDAAAVARRLYIGEGEAGQFLTRLAAMGFLRVTENQEFQYSPASPALAEIADRIAETYARYLVPLTNLIHTKPRTKVKKFADAFKIRKDKDPA